jgi:hypothetical protein
LDHAASVERADTPPRELAEQPAMVTSLRMPVELYQRLKAAADRRGTTMSALLRAGLRWSWPPRKATGRSHAWRPSARLPAFLR